MPKVKYGGQSYECEDQSVLDCLTAHGVPIPSSCRSGVCQTCMMRAVSGEVPQKAKSGLKSTLAAQNYFLACTCIPQEDVEIVLPEQGLTTLDASVTGVENLGPDILGVKIKPSRPLEYRAGQFISLFKDKTTSRCYSLASVPTLDDELFLHVRKVPGGLVSGWIFNHLRPGDTITISEAHGDCFYVAGKPQQDVLLIATGCGLAPLYGIVRDALLHGHQGRICLYHGSCDTGGLYLVKELRNLAQEYPNFSYAPCVSDGTAPEGCLGGMVLDVALAANPDLSGWRVFLCGNPDMVKAAQQETYLAGASIQEIFVDPC